MRAFLKNDTVILDGGMGTMLQNAGMAAGECAELWNITYPDEVVKVHRAYFDAGSNIVNTNTFGANALKYGDTELESIISAAVKNAQTARDTSSGCQKKFVALDIGPCGRMLSPAGDLGFEDAVGIFAKSVRLGVKYGVDLIFIETFTDAYETKAALLAAKENSSLPVFVSNAYEDNGRTLTGSSPEIMAEMLTGLGADAVGLNCGSLSSETILSVTESLLRSTHLPVIIKPNAGLPVVRDGKTVWETGPSVFAGVVAECVKKGASLAGGCCGTTPEFISAVKNAVSGSVRVSRTKEHAPCAASSVKLVRFGRGCVPVGERLNPTGKKRLKQAVAEKDFAYITGEAVAQEKNGALVLDVNVGVPGTDEAEFLPQTVAKIQTVTGLPLQIDTSDYDAMEKAARLYNGAPLLNSVSGKRESMDRVFPVLAKYGGSAVALLLDENGIPSDVQGRMGIFEKILAEAEKYGLGDRLIFDPLTLPVSTDRNSAAVTLALVAEISGRGYPTVLGVSNISFGLPGRDTLNASFLAMAAGRGLSAAIVNPASEKISAVISSANALLGAEDDNFAAYVAFASENTDNAPKTADAAFTLKEAVKCGLGDAAAQITEKLLGTVDALGVINGEIIPALDETGRDYENGKTFLPGLLAAANSASAAFGVIKSRAGAGKSNGKRFVIATVEGDVHDIGKNIVKLLLENYGFDVLDLGKNVKKEDVLAAVLENDAKILGLSALMTTTVPAMEKTIKLVHENAPDCRIIVGGAVLTEEYAARIGADFYAQDALRTVRIAEKL